MTTKRVYAADTNIRSRTDQFGRQVDKDGYAEEVWCDGCGCLVMLPHIFAEHLKDGRDLCAFRCISKNKLPQEVY